MQKNAVLLKYTIALWIVIGIISFCVLALIFNSFYNTSHEVVLTKTGFSPKNLVIKEGETVVFKTNDTAPFWPASNVHPTHTNFPDFDPKKPLSPDQSWSFTFDKAGTYRFHDHIRSNFEGEITVVRTDGVVVETNCSIEKTSECWEKMILETLKIEGIKAAFDTIVRLSETEPGFSSDCHGLSHLIGEKAYAQYVAQENFELTPATALCGYGFYHGFMETMLLATGDVDGAREFCQMVDEKLKGQASAAATACYHGSGHGAVDGSDPTAWGDAEKMMEPGFKLCEQLAANELERYLCDTGVMNAIEILSADPKYGLQEMREDPLVLCNAMPVFRREGCYANMMPIVFQNFNYDFQKIIDYTNEHMTDGDAVAIDGNTVNDLTIIGIMFEFIRMYRTEDTHMQRGVDFCRLQNSDDRLPCIAGLSGGYMKYGVPGSEYVQNLEFCSLTDLKKDERDSCYQYMLPRLQGRYAPIDVTMICSKVPEEYSLKYCTL